MGAHSIIRADAAGVRRLRAALFTLVGLVAGMVSCFAGDYLTYAACDASEPCRDAGLHACVLRPELAGAPGFCAPTCDEPCPPATDGDAEPICLTIDGSSVCVLSCEGGLQCPTSMACAAVTTGAEGRASLCFPEGEG